MTCVATLRRSGGSIILAIPRTIAETMAVEAGSVVELTVSGRTMSIAPVRRSLADRLAASPKSPARWGRDDQWLGERSKGRELL
jgi:antitoxin ChpS